MDNLVKVKLELENCIHGVESNIQTPFTISNTFPNIRFFQWFQNANDRFVFQAEGIKSDIESLMKWNSKLLTKMA
jgi:hypothetical protein